MDKKFHTHHQFSNSEMMYKLERLANIGWWKADFKKQIFVFSDYICEVLELKNNTISFDFFLSLVHPEHRERILYSFFILQQFDTYNETFPIMTPQGYWWIHSEAGEQEEDENGDVQVFGFAQYFKGEDIDKIEERVSKTQLNDLLRKHNSISKSLLSFLKNTDTHHVITKILNEIMQQFEGDRVYIFEYNWTNNTHSCIYEVTVEDVHTGIDSLQDLSVDKYTWLTQQFMEQRPIVLNSLDDLPSDSGEIRHVLYQQNIQSLMVVPLVSDKGLWGYMGVDIVKHKRRWNALDYEWFNSFANIISLCIQLRNSRDALQGNEERLKKIYQTIPVGIEIYDNDGYLRDINNVEMDIFGIKDKQDVLGISLYDNPSIPAKIKDSIRSGCDTNFQLNLKFSKAQDYYHTVLEGAKHLCVKGSPLRGTNNTVVGYLLIIIDDTETLNAYNRLKEFDNIFAFISEFAGIGLYMWNPILKTGYASEQWFKNLNEKHSDIKDVIEKYDTLHPEDQNKVAIFYQNVIEGKAQSMQEELRVGNGNSWKWIRSHSKVKEFDPQNDSIEVIGVNIDISELKAVENELLEAKLRAEEADRLKSAFLANMSHEIRTPLNAIVGFSNVIAEADDAEDKSQYMEIIQRNTDLLLQLISDILDLSKIESGNFDIIYEPTNINTLCREILHTYQIKNKKDIQLLFEDYRPSCSIYTDKNRLSQLISNLVNNALKFTTEGFVKLGYFVRDNEIEFYVQDTGVGIASDKTAQIFDRFIKLNVFTNGTGLGLSICRSIIEKMGGRIGVESQIGVGSRFWFTLPLETTKEKIRQQFYRAEKVFDEQEVATCPVILIAEDNDSNFLLLQSILKHQSQIIRAYDGIDAIEVCKEQSPDLILMDIKMPGMNGLDATRKIRETGCQTPIIALTAFAMETDCQQALQAGCNDYLVKPIKTDKLKESIQKYLHSN